DVTETAMYVPERMNDQVSSLDLRGMRGIRQISLPRFEPDQQRRTGIGGAQGVHGEEVAKQLADEGVAERLRPRTGTAVRWFLADPDVCLAMLGCQLNQRIAMGPGIRGQPT